jgi:Alginate lyase
MHNCRVARPRLLLEEVLLLHTTLHISRMTHCAHRLVQLATSHPDNIWLRDTIDACKWLGLAYYFSGDAKYALQLRQRVRTFFLDEAMGMLPNLRYAQSIPGVVDGRPQVRAPRSLCESTAHRISCSSHPKKAHHICIQCVALCLPVQQAARARRSALGVCVRAHQAPRLAASGCTPWSRCSKACMVQRTCWSSLRLNPRGSCIAARALSRQSALHVCLRRSYSVAFGLARGTSLLCATTQRALS